MKDLDKLILTVDGENYNYKEEDRLVNKSIASLGDGGKNTIIITIEELSELTQAIINYMEDNNYETYLNLAEELTDVYICLRYVNFVFNLDTRVTMSKVYKNGNILNSVGNLARLSQALTKYLRNKTDIYEIFDAYLMVKEELRYISNYYNIDNELIIKIRKLKTERLRKVLEEGEKY